MTDWYFAYGSNMNPDRMADRQIVTRAALSGCLCGFRLAFDKRSRAVGEGHANVVYQPRARVEGVLYQLHAEEELGKLDRFERTPINYSREVIPIAAGDSTISAWVYIANPGARSAGLLPTMKYLSHLLAGADFLSADYLATLRAQPVLPQPSR